MDSPVSGWILVWHSEEAKAMKPRTDDMSIEDQTAEEDGCNFFKRSASISRKSQVRDTLTSKPSRQMLVTPSAESQKSRRSGSPIADGTAPVSAGIGEKQLAKDRTNSTRPALPVAKRSVDSGGGKTSINPKPQLIRPRGDQSDDQSQRPKKQIYSTDGRTNSTHPALPVAKHPVDDGGKTSTNPKPQLTRSRGDQSDDQSQRPKKQIHSTESRDKKSIEQQPTSNEMRDDDSGDRAQRPKKQIHSTGSRDKKSIEQQPTSNEMRDDDSGDRVQRPAKLTHLTEDRSKSQTTRKSTVAEDQRGQSGDNGQGANKHISPVDASSKTQTTEKSEVARHRRNHPDNQGQRSKKQTHPADTTRLSNAPSSVADQASTSMKGRRREPTLHSSNSPAKGRRIDGPDHLNADERQFIDEREHISIVGLYIDINERRASECPPRPPLSNVWPVNWHRGRGRWHFEDGDPDMEEIDRWLKARDW
ncbi:unnamed protein product [Jaminaea pallidilutea]